MKMMSNQQLWQAYCTEFGDMLGIGAPVPDAVLNRTIRDDRYAYYLLTSRHNPDLLNALLRDRKNEAFALGEDDAEPERLYGPDLLITADKALRLFASQMYEQRQKERQDSVYQAFSKEEEKQTGKACKPCAEIKVDNFREVYFDHHATTYVRPEVGQLLSQYYHGVFGYGNPSSANAQGKYAAKLVADARRQVAECLEVMPEEVVFTGSGTEANNLAIKGIALRHLARNGGHGHLITSRIEHTSVLETMAYLETLGFDVTYLDVGDTGIVSADAVREAIRPDTILVSVMAVNNEIGTIQPIAEIGEICRERGVPFMVDAVQAFGKLKLSPKQLGITLLTFSGHKIYAPKGIGGLYVQSGIELAPQVHGGGQESGLRSGTENVGGVIALAKAAELAHREMDVEQARLKQLTDYFLMELAKIVPDYVVNGSLEQRVPGSLSIGFPYVDSGALVRSLSRIGISVSAGSACSSNRTKTSHVIAAIGADTEKYATIRISFGLKTSYDDVNYMFKYLARILELIREQEQIA